MSSRERPPGDGGGARAFWGVGNLPSAVFFWVKDLGGQKKDNLFMQREKKGTFGEFCYGLLDFSGTSDQDDYD